MPFPKLIFASALTLIVSRAASWAIDLPVEVMGADGVVETVSFALTEEGGDSLWLKVHNLSYDGKASVRVNAGDWVDLRNEASEVTIQEPEQSYGGIGGGFSTIRLQVDVANEEFQLGDNQIQFRFNETDGVSSGYRVIEMNILDSEGTRLLGDEDFERDDPASWVAPLSGAEAIAAGKELWLNGDIKSPGGEDWRANCASCHTETGSDLKYFNYSNKAIITRSMFHGLTEVEGQRIASYIRSLDYYAPAQARPWNPPYQPGPGIDSKPVSEWAAGAGLEAVLENDEAMLPYLFGDASRESIDAATDIRGDLNLREMPIAVQFPDWRLWLPRIHPMDLWGVDFWENSGTVSGNASFLGAFDAYEEIKDKFENQDLANSSDLIQEVERFSAQVMWWIGNANSGHPWTGKDADDGVTLGKALENGYRAEEAKLALSRWHAVKLWELLHGYGVEDKAIAIRATAEKYQWPSNRFAVFQIAAHFIGDDRGTSAFIGEDLVVGTYFSSIWYQLQMVLNSGMRSGYAVAPVDWAYNFFHVNRLGERSGVYEPLRLLQNLIKGYQQRDRGGEIDKHVWSMREVSPWRVYSGADGEEDTIGKLDTYRLGLRVQATSSLIHQFLRRSNEYSVSDWPRTSEIALNSANWYRLEEESYVPKEEPYSVTKSKLFTNNESGDTVEADTMYRLIPRLATLGVEPSVVNGLIDWSKQFWPLGDWESFRVDPWLDSDDDGMPDEWEGRQFGNLIQDGDEDKDKDGRSNFMEYVLGNSPTRSDGGSEAIVVVSSFFEDQMYMDIEYERRKDDPRLDSALEVSTDLKVWSEVPEEISEEDSRPGFERVKARGAIGEEGRLFTRWKVKRLSSE